MVVTSLHYRLDLHPTDSVLTQSVQTSHRKPSCVPPGCFAAASCPHLHSRKPPFPQSNGHDAIRFIPKDHRTGVDTMRIEDGTSGMTALPMKPKSRLLCRCGESAGTITAKIAIAGWGSDGHGHRLTLCGLSVTDRCMPFGVACSANGVFTAQAVD